MLRELHPDAALADDIALADFLHQFTASGRSAALISASLSLLGVILLIVGCSSLFVATLRDRRREIALRVALGANLRRLKTDVVRQGLLIALVGVVPGFLVAHYLVNRMVASPTLTPGGEIVAFGIAAAAIVGAICASTLYAATEIDEIDLVRQLRV
jgi:ABC-type antimicrobial peptide transport system permease subunit